ncbi:polysaccharide deacetylase family protein [Chryseobacterium taihuense]|uniref:Peptidoglycan/xylan/chitin deacetylase, PgdA/CDA1 family n=1 Tax=Chryseobacterium taihuense TaxID=1141221 RepID=A0ABY0QUY3_9FLAO|nr:polysaccharide deacetylase family protein [Chryseobacterium taihuense]SDL94968.1 Peptidoglycan/xylan/chitin deacetylase, PgdA/CDA1 family [Chryseobacterium taihuense]
MYHSVLPEKEIKYKNNLTVSRENLEKQLFYIKNNYNTLFFKDLESNKSLENKLILTFDDGYYNNVQHLVPLLEKYGLKATIFIPTQLILNDTSRTFMTFKEIKNLNPDLIEIALHSHSHRNYAQISLQEAEEDIIENIKTLEKYEIRFTKILAYPYGKFPIQKKNEFFNMLEKAGITAALRIGNNIDTYPWKNKFEIQRIDIKGSDNLSVFKWKLRLGKIRP